MFLTRIRLLLLLAALLVPSRNSADEPRSLVRFHITDAFGRPLRTVRILIRAGGSTKQLEGDQRSLSLQLEPNTYQVTIQAQGFRSLSRDFVIWESEHLVSSGLCVARQEDLTPITLKGKVFLDGQPGAEVRLIGVFTDERSVSKISSSGEFTAKLSCEGTYILVVAQDETILDERRVNVEFTNPPIVLDLRRK